ncbi:hypothetical protein H3V13_01570 [Bartonella sp. M0280]|uniref:hypothetical protein n=1 Tax=Bartonella apihabitans TaxID=2750929 RepID=UPI001AEF097F|nr:hypothetical protein [Bartonella apihabitans]MBI0025223.1 hypothetical protein [Bartonella apihabitans]MBI0166650.1 hypothetical protein [Bartonella apihabitans]
MFLSEKSAKSFKAQGIYYGKAATGFIDNFRVKFGVIQVCDAPSGAMGDAV